MKYFFYSNIKAVQGSLVDIYEGDFIAWCNNHCSPTMISKSDFPLFTPALFEGLSSARRIENLTGFHNLVLDFDNKEGVSNYDDVTRELITYTFIAYDTISSTKENRRFRVILPFSNSLDEKSFELLKNKVIHILQGSLEGLDQSSFDRARAFFIPTPNTFSEFNKGTYFNECKLFLDQELNITLPKSAQEKGRNDNLKAQVFAALNKDVPIQQIAEEILEYDLKNNNPPLFSDTKENFKTKDPKVNALVFVTNCAVTHANAHRKSITFNDNELTVGASELLKFQEKADETKRKEDAFFEFDESLCKAPGLVGEIADWINSASNKPIPALSLASALTGVGMVKAHRVRSETNLRTNLYTIGLAPSGGGKEDSMKLMKKLLKATGHKDHIMGDPESASGLLSSLSNMNGQAFLGWSEVGLALQSYTDKNAGGHLSKVIKVLLRLFSEADMDVEGGEYSTRSRQDIKQPCLSIYGSSVPDEFFKSLSVAHGSNGFLARWLVFATSQRGKENPTAVDYEEIPQYLINKLKQIRAMSKNPSGLDDLSQSVLINPKIVKYTDQARSLLSDIKAHYEIKIQKLLEEGSSLDSVWQRAIEHIIKISLTLSDNNFITRDDLDYSSRLVEFILDKSSQMYLEYGNQGEFANTCREVLDIIRKSGKKGITLAQFNRVKRLPLTYRDQVFKSLKESEQIIEVKDTAKTRPVTSFFYQKDTRI